MFIIIYHFSFFFNFQFSDSFRYYELLDFLFLDCFFFFDFSLFLRMMNDVYHLIWTYPYSYLFLYRRYDNHKYIMITIDKSI